MLDLKISRNNIIAGIVVVFFGTLLAWGTFVFKTARYPFSEIFGNLLLIILVVYIFASISAVSITIWQYKTGMEKQRLVTRDSA